MKILFTSVGRRVELVQSFKKAASELNTNLLIYGADIVDSAPALQFCDRTVLLPKIKSDEYIPTLLKYCSKENIDCLIPTIDTDLLILSKNAKEFQKIGTKVIISSTNKIEICRDKNLTANYFLSLGLDAPQTVNDVKKYNNPFPAFIKPKDGSSSKNAFKVETYSDLELYAKKIGDYVIQQLVEGVEYTVDIMCDFDGNPIYITPRERMIVRAGEVLKTRICQDDTIISEMKTLISDFKPIGPITVQLIQNKETNKNYYIEINPRFGGGAPLSCKAGADSAKALINLINGEKLEYKPYAARHNEIYSRFDQSICVQKGYENGNS